MGVFNVRDNLLHIKTNFPRPIRQIDHVWIPMSDGTRLAARIWLPEDAEAHPVPALLEYIPYRKNDFTALRDSIRHPYFAGHGYASVRVDMRGSGDSEGILYDEYLQQEQDDAIEVIEWLARQPWSTGAVGMFGKSWGGFNALQVAARRPEALKAIITLCSTDDRYATDVHYMGNCLLASDMLWWGCYMLAYNARPPDPKVVGDRWREMWLERLEQTPPFVEAWLSHQRRDAYWQHGSVCEDFSAIQCPVFAVGGWSDGYTDAVLRLLEGLTSPKLGLIGPWSHDYPEVAVPGPQIGFLQECLRWWDHWLKNQDTGILNEPMLRAYLQESAAPQPYYDWRDGRWVAERVWPKRDETEVYMIVDKETRKQGDKEHKDSPPLLVSLSPCLPLTIPSIQTHGLHGGVWCPFGSIGDWPSDQRADDALALCFDSEPVNERMEYLGFPEVRLKLSSDKPNSFVAVRLCDVSPDGASTLVSVGVLNLADKLPGEITIRLNAIGYALLPGHRWRVAIAPTYWNRIWPSPEAATLTLYGGELRLPIRSPQPDDALVTFLPPEAAAVLERETLRGDDRKRIIEHDLVNGTVKLIDYADDGWRRLQPDGIDYDTIIQQVFTIKEGDPLSAATACDFTINIGRGDWRTRIETHSTMSCDAVNFYLHNQLTAYEGTDVEEREVFRRTWVKVVERSI